ncbi:MAG TPA: D-alanyl-D-alanine carboxypeptidase/D-alanyl-D-alanine-endopeptidase, partial [Cytophagaceae bacterium]
MKNLLMVYLICQVTFAYTQLKDTSVKRIKDEIELLSKSETIKYGYLGVCISKMNADNNIVEYNHSKTFVPASNLKLFTTATALDILGESFVFETTIEYEGEVKNGKLTGNLNIIGSGDPTLGSERFKDYPDYKALIKLFVAKIKAAGIAEIKGDIVSDASVYEYNSIPDFWVWGDMGNYYGAGAFGLNINENLYTIFFKPGEKEGAPATVANTEPKINLLDFKNEVLTGKENSGDNTVIYGGALENNRYMNGTIPKGSNLFPVKGSIPDPPAFIASLLYNELIGAGVKVSGGPKRAVDNSKVVGRKIVYSHASPPLKAIIEKTNVYSINLYAESLLKQIAYKKTGKGTTKEGVKAVTEYLASKGISKEGLFIYDGSGLSPTNALTPLHQTQLLKAIRKENYFDAFYNSLSVAGVSGTLKKLCKGTAGENNIRGKSGSMEKVLCYTGYVKGKSGETYVFSIMANDFSGSTSG